MPRLGLNSSGAYRKLMSYPKQLSWRRCERPLPVPGPTAIDSTIASEGKTSGEEILADDGGKSVELSFSLSKASYATVLLRELMKTS